MRSVRLFLLAAVAVLAATAGPPQASTWREARSAHFTLFLEGGEDEARTQVRNLETFREILGVLSPDLQHHRILARPQLPAYVYLFRRSREFQTYAGLKGLEGLFAQHPDGTYISVDLGSDEGTQVIYHEYLHQFLATNFPGVPLWLNEGMATFFQTMTLDDLDVRLGKPPHGFLDILFHRGVMRLDRLMAVDHQSRDYQEGPDRGWFYASAWFLVDYLMTGEEPLRVKLGNYLDLVRSGRHPKDAFLEAFQTLPTSLDGILADHLQKLAMRKTITTWIIQFRTLGPTLDLRYRQLPWAEAQGRLGLLATGPKKLRDLAIKHCETALLLDPASGPANLGMGLLALEANRFSEASASLEAACRAEPDNGEVHRLAALALLEANAANLDAPTLGIVRGHLLRCLQLGFSSPGTLKLLMDVARTYDPPAPGDIASLQEASRLLPGAFDLKWNLVDLHLRSGRRDLAEPLLTELAAQTVQPVLAASARARLLSWNQEDVERLRNRSRDAFNRKDYTLALADLEGAMALCQDPNLLKDLQEELARMKVLVDLRRQPAPRKK